MLLIMGLLSACDQSNAEFEAYLKSLKLMPLGDIEPIPDFQFIQRETLEIPPLLRNPFEMSSRPMDHRQSLDNIALRAFKFVGVINDGVHFWALIKHPDQRIVRVQIGDAIGEHHGRLIAIEETELTIEQTMMDQKRRVLMSLE
jgi:type IV pilus assembly protein PilP